MLNLLMLTAMNIFARSLCANVVQFQLAADPVSFSLQILETTHPMMSTVLSCAIRCAGSDNCLGFAYGGKPRQCQLVGRNATLDKYVHTKAQSLYVTPGASAPPIWILPGTPKSTPRLLHTIRYLILPCNPNCDISTAKSMCTKIGATLAPLRTKEIFDFMTRYKNDVGIDIVHIDGNDDATEGTWVYHDGTPLSYQDWFTGQPEHPDTTQNSLILGSNDVMWDVRSHETFAGVTCAWE